MNNIINSDNLNENSSNSNRYEEVILQRLKKAICAVMIRDFEYFCFLDDYHSGNLKKTSKTYKNNLPRLKLIDSLKKTLEPFEKGEIGTSLFNSINLEKKVDDALSFEAKKSGKTIDEINKELNAEINYFNTNYTETNPTETLDQGIVNQAKHLTSKARELTKEEFEKIAREVFR